MKILLVADLHYALKQFDWVLEVAEDYDAVVVAGDLLEVSSSVPQMAQAVVTRTYIEKIAAKTRLFVCSGNHDLTETDTNGERVPGWLWDCDDLDVITDGGCAEIGDTVVSVLPWWDGEVTKKRIAEQLERDSRRVGKDWIWIHHAPPSGSSTAWSGQRHYGDIDLSHWISHYRPTAVLSGHVHQAPFVPDGSWVDRVEKTWVFNMGQQPGDAPAHIVIDTDEGHAAWISLSGAQNVTLDLNLPDVAPQEGAPDWLIDADR